MAAKSVLAVDLGAESGRVMAVRFDGERLALEELEFFSSYLRILGVYKASPMRAEIASRMLPPQDA